MNCNFCNAGGSPASRGSRKSWPAGEPPALQKGYTLAAALVLIAILSILMAMSLPLWEKVKQREMEEELIFRGKEYAEAIGRYHVKFNSYPPDLETLEKQKFIRKLYKDPMTESGKWKVLRPDSLVETGAAGSINQPGQPGSQGREQGEEEGEGEVQIPQTPQSTEREPGSQENTEEQASGEEDESAEEPESEVVGPIAGVVSRSKKTSMRVYNGQSSYNKWVFTYSVPQGQRPQGGKDEKPGKGGAKPKSPKPVQKPGQNQEQN